MSDNKYMNSFLVSQLYPLLRVAMFALAGCQLAALTTSSPDKTEHVLTGLLFLSFGITVSLLNKKRVQLLKQIRQQQIQEDKQYNYNKKTKEANS